MKPNLHVAAALAAVLLLGSACSGSGQSHDAPAPRLVPWTDAVPTQLIARQPSAAPACRAALLRVVGPGLQLTPEGPGGTGTITVRNAGSTPCRLTGRPAVSLVGTTDAPRQRQVPLPAAAPTFPDVVPPAATLLALAPNGAAVLGIQWSNWCPPRRAPGTRVVPPRAVHVTLPDGGGSLDAGYNAVPDCVAPAQPSTIGVRPFAPAPLPQGAPWSSAALSATIRPSDGSKLTARRGQLARFRVLLQNKGSVPVTFDARCPMFVELLEPAGTQQVHQLNCAAAGTLAPHATLAFEMRLPVPANAPLGANGLLWELDPTGAQAPEAVAALHVTR